MPPRRGVCGPGWPGIGWPKKRRKNSCIWSSSGPSSRPARDSPRASMLTTAGPVRSTRALKSGKDTSGGALAAGALCACTGCCACCQQATSTAQLKKPTTNRDTGVNFDMCVPLGWRREGNSGPGRGQDAFQGGHRHLAEHHVARAAVGEHQAGDRILAHLRLVLDGGRLDVQRNAGQAVAEQIMLGRAFAAAGDQAEALDVLE